MTGAKRDWTIRLGAIFWFIGLVIFLLSAPVLLQASPLILLAVVALAALIAFPLTWIARRFLKPNHSFRLTWLRCAVAALFALCFLVAAPVYYLAIYTEARPALVPQAVLTNGRKTIVFQGMQHVGLESFYKSVVYDLEDALSRGYVLYYEGVRPSTPQANAWFDHEITSGRDLTDLYRSLGDLCGMRFQNDYFQVLARDFMVHPQSHVMADVSTLDMKNEYDRLVATDPAFAKAIKAEEKSNAAGGPDRMEAVVRFLKHGTTGQRDLAGTLCRGIMTVAFSDDDKSSGPPEPMNRLILDYRNRELAKRIINEPRTKIYMTYGSAHLPGLLQLLRANDPNWHIASTKWMRTIDAPEMYHRTLAGVPAVAPAGSPRASARTK